MNEFQLEHERHSLQALHRSCNQNQTAIIQSIMVLHNDGKPFSLDPCFNKGTMYGGTVPLPEKRMDIDIEIVANQGLIHGDFTKMPFNDQSMQSIIADPPFIVGRSTYVMSERYGYFESIEHLQVCLDRLVKECARVIKRDGLLVLKCQDIIVNRRKYFVSIFLINTAIKYGFCLVDEYIKTNKSLPTQLSENTSASRSYHSKFLVFRFRRGRRSYVL